MTSVVEKVLETASRLVDFDTGTVSQRVHVEPDDVQRIIERYPNLFKSTQAGYRSRRRRRWHVSDQEALASALEALRPIEPANEKNDVYVSVADRMLIARDLHRRLGQVAPDLQDSLRVTILHHLQRSLELLDNQISRYSDPGAPVDIRDASYEVDLGPPKNDGGAERAEPGV